MLPLTLASLVPAPGALTNVTLVGTRFDYTGLRAQWSSHCVVYLLFSQAVARRQDRFAPERAFPLECATSSLKFFPEPNPPCASYHGVSHPSVDGTQPDYP